MIVCMKAMNNHYLGQENYDQALEYYRQALAGFEAKKAAVGTSYALANIGVVYSYLGRYDEALSYLEKSRKMKMGGHVLDNICAIFQIRGFVLIGQGSA